mgnify:CR=1 FL=1
MQRIEVIKGDITKLSVDAIVNAANNSLMGGGGVDGAIHSTGGQAILDQCMEIIRRQGECKTGQAVITTAGNLPAKYVIHTVGPVWHGGEHGESEKLRECYRNSLKLEVENNLQTIAFPNISTGVYEFPKPLAAEIAIDETMKCLRRYPSIVKVVFVCFGDENYGLYNALLP